MSDLDHLLAWLNTVAEKDPSATWVRQFRALSSYQFTLPPGLVVAVPPPGLPVAWPATPFGVDPFARRADRARTIAGEWGG